MPRQELWLCIMKSEVVKKLTQDLYEDSETVVRCVVEVTDGFKVGMGLYEGSALRQADRSGQLGDCGLWCFQVAL